MSENTTIGRDDQNFTGGAYHGQEGEQRPTTDMSQQFVASTYDQPQDSQDQANQGNALN